MASGDRGIRYAVFAGKRNLDKKQLTHPSGSSDIRIAPVLVGSKQAGLFQVLAGAVLMVVGAVSMYFGNAYGPQMMMMGAALALGGIAQMMAPQPATDGGFSSRTSYNFNGAQNITQQGGPVPLLYGRMRIGSVVISEGMLAKDGTAQLIGGHPVAVT